jgi:sulfate adenylyltransferase subunit 1 (EFTu-like GTPase family)
MKEINKQTAIEELENILSEIAELKLSVATKLLIDKAQEAQSEGSYSVIDVTNNDSFRD